ncbi:hypothetical protein RRG08_021078 [Elysia crispata]|uniref:Uncharacterized protein n=1 Tax=Elysia crispata TaxID=231223 RepID=A0AAE1CXI5_9GAST|nr:hypothetical protein RRG08_021078 [Elysia crispata]
MRVMLIPAAGFDSLECWPGASDSGPNTLTADAGLGHHVGSTRGVKHSLPSLISHMSRVIASLQLSRISVFQRVAASLTQAEVKSVPSRIDEPSWAEMNLQLDVPKCPGGLLARQAWAPMGCRFMAAVGEECLAAARVSPVAPARTGTSTWELPSSDSSPCTRVTRSRFRTNLFIKIMSI